MDTEIKGHQTRISDHAVARYRDRVHPAGTRTAARAQLAAVAAAVGRWSDTAPPWISTAEAARADRWLLLGDDVALPCCGYTLVTVLVRGGRTPAQQAQRDRQRARKWQRRNARRLRQQRTGRLSGN